MNSFSVEDHINQLLSHITKCYKDKQLLDVMLKPTSLDGTELGIVLCHRMVVAAYSPFLRSAFEENSQTELKRTISIDDIGIEALKSCIEWCYYKNLSLTNEDVFDVFKAARKLEIQPIINICVDKIISMIDETNFLMIFNISEERLKSEVMKFIADNFTQLVDSERLLELSFNDISNILDFDELYVDSELVVFRGMCSWLEHDPTNRRSLSPQLLRKIRLALIAHEDIIMIVAKHPLIHENKENERMVTYIKDYFLLQGYGKDIQLENPRQGKSRNNPRKQ